MAQTKKNANTRQTEKIIKSVDSIPWKERRWGHALARNAINAKYKLGLGLPNWRKNPFRTFPQIHTKMTAILLAIVSLISNLCAPTDTKQIRNIAREAIEALRDIDGYPFSGQDVVP